MRKPRDCQTRLITAVREAFASGKKGVVVEAFTGFGKGYVIAEIASRVMAKKGRVLVLVNRDNLVEQLNQSLIDQGMTPEIERGQNKASNLANCVVGSIQTIQNTRLKRWNPEHFKLVITDEIHFGASNTFKTTLDYFKTAHHLGLSATIERHDKKGLWKGYEECVFSMPLAEGISEGWLVPFEFEALPVPIVIEDKLATKKMFTEEDEMSVFEKDSYLPRLFSEAASRATQNKSLFFWPNCKSSEEAAVAFQSHGIESRHVDGYMSKTLIAEILDWFKSPGIKSLHNADLLSYGYDNPTIDLIGIMRLSRSIPMLKQRLGRGTRPLCKVDDCETAQERCALIAASPKPFCKVLDLMLQLGDVQNKFATATALITENDEERKFIDEERKKKPSISMEDLELKLKTKRETDRDKALAKLAEDAANAAEKAKNKREPYYQHILNRPNGSSLPCHPYALKMLKKMGYTGPDNLTKQKCYLISKIFEQSKQKLQLL